MEDKKRQPIGGVGCLLGGNEVKWFYNTMQGYFEEIMKNSLEGILSDRDFIISIVKNDAGNARSGGGVRLDIQCCADDVRPVLHNVNAGS